jgi:hypothetical protein
MEMEKWMLSGPVEQEARTFVDALSSHCPELSLAWVEIIARHEFTLTAFICVRLRDRRELRPP